MASLGMEYLARNLYERANDCRWWALNGTLIGALTGREGCDPAAASAVLAHINSLYTVYHSIVLFDSERRVVAVSREDQAGLVGTRIEEQWSAHTLTLSDSQSYTVSPFQTSTFANEQSTLIYAAALRGQDRRVVGGVAVVFDTAPQLKAMLLDVLPRDERGEPLAGSIAMFLDRNGKLMSATDPQLEADGAMLTAVRESMVGGGARTIRVANEYYALGAKQDAGYREYVGIGAFAVVLLPLGTVPERNAEARRPLPQCTGGGARSDHSRQDVREFTTFSSAGGWYALPTSSVLEAVDAKALQSITTAGEPWAGVVMHGSEAVPVVNLGTLLELPAADSLAVVILVRVEGDRVVGVLVEALGDNPEVPAERLLPISTLEQSRASMLIEQAIQPVGDGDGLVLVLSVGRLGAMLFGASAVAA